MSGRKTPVDHQLTDNAHICGTSYIPSAVISQHNEEVKFLFTQRIARHQRLLLYIEWVASRRQGDRHRTNSLEGKGKKMLGADSVQGGQMA